MANQYVKGLSGSVPSDLEGGAKILVFTLRLNERERDSLKLCAERRSCSQSEVIRHLILSDAERFGLLKNGAVRKELRTDDRPSLSKTRGIVRW